MIDSKQKYIISFGFVKHNDVKKSHVHVHVHYVHDWSYLQQLDGPCLLQRGSVMNWILGSSGQFHLGGVEQPTFVEVWFS